MNKESQKKINFNKDDIKFLLLNILGHDVIHDFYGNLGKERWDKVKSLANQFKSSFTMTAGGSETETITSSTNTSDNQKILNLRLVTGQKRTREDSELDSVSNQDQPSKVQKIGEITPLYNLVNDEEEFSSFCTDIGNDIQFKLFYVVANVIYNNKVNNANEELNISSSFDFFIPNDLKSSDDSDNTPEIKSKLYSILRDRFIDYYFDNLSDSTNDNAMEIDSGNSNVYPDITYTNMFNLLYDFITDDYYFSYTIYNFLINNNQIGGDDDDEQMDIANNEPMEISENTTFVEKMAEKKKEMEEPPNGFISKIVNIVSSDNKQNIDDKIKNYQRFKVSILSDFKAIIREYKQDTLAGGFDNFLLPLSFDKATKLISLKDEINSQYNKLMKKYSDIDKKERAKLVGSTLKVKSPAYDVKESFAFMIIKGSLYLTGCVDEKQKPIITDISQEQIDLITNQFNIINEINEKGYEINDVQKSALTEICETIKINNEFILPYIKEYIIFQTVLNLNKNIDYDGFLINFIKEFFKKYEYTNESQQRYECIDVNDKYVINNASNLVKFSPKQLDLEIFCPYSSILDAMPQCKYNDSKKKCLLEYGDINFNLINTDSNMYYNGSSKIVKNDDGNIFSKTNLDIKLPLLTIKSEVDVKVNYDGRSQLSAEDSLRTTLTDMIQFIEVQERPVLDQIFKGKEIFENLYAMATEEKVTSFQTGAEKSEINFNYSNFIIDTSVNANLNIFGVVFNKILIKGTGDLYQEINSVCKYGGYVGDNYHCDEKILSYNNTTGNQTRFFAANDRPSASRFIFILCNGAETEVNTKSLGGYVSGSNNYIVSKYTNPKNNQPNPCEPNPYEHSQCENNPSESNLSEPNPSESSKNYEGGLKHKKSKRNIKNKNKKTKNKNKKTKNNNKKLNTIKRKHKKHNKTKRIK